MSEYRSGLEERFALQLDRHGVRFEYEQHKYPLTMPTRMHVCMTCSERKQIVRLSHYTPDFHIYAPDGTLRAVVEVKGRWTGKDRTISTRYMEEFPAFDYRMFFGYDNKISKKSDTRYSDWCHARNIEFAVGTVPVKWLKEFTAP